MSDETAIKKYTDAMSTFLEKYNEDVQTDEMKFEDCGGEYKFNHTFFLLQFSKSKFSDVNRK